MCALHPKVAAWKREATRSRGFLVTRSRRCVVPGWGACSVERDVPLVAAALSNRHNCVDHHSDRCRRARRYPETSAASTRVHVHAAAR